METWVKQIIDVMRCGTANVVLLTGNIRDVPVPDNRPLTAAQYLHQQARTRTTGISQQGSLVYLRFTQSGGFQLQRTDDLAVINQHLMDFYEQQCQQCNLQPETDPDERRVAARCIDDPSQVTLPQAIDVIDRLMRCNVDGFLIFLDYCDLIASSPFRNLAVNPTLLEMIQEWAVGNQYRYIRNGATLQARHSWVVLLADAVSDVFPNIARHPLIFRAEIGLPDLELRTKAFQVVLNDLSGRYPNIVSADCDPALMARLASGLRVTDCLHAPLHAVAANQPFDEQFLYGVKHSVLARDYDNVLTPVVPRLTFEDIGGLDEVKKYFLQLKGLVTNDLLQYMPSGVILLGPPGTGKSALIQALASELGFQMVVMDPSKIFNSLLGETEKAMAAALSCISTMAPVIVYIDEIDQALVRNNRGDGGTSGRVFAHLMSFMADTRNAQRGIFFAAATNQPQAVDAAVMRQGRLGDLIPILPPRTAAERLEIVTAVCHQLGLQLAIPRDEALEICGTRLGTLYTGAEIHAIIMSQVRDQALQTGLAVTQLTPELLRTGFEQTSPSTRMVAEWTQSALEYASDGRFIPPSWRADARPAGISHKRGIIPDSND